MMEPPVSRDNNKPETIATPEGDNEGLPSEPPAPADVDLQRPRGDEPHWSQPIRPALD
jgi:hypothetical protein